MIWSFLLACTCLSSPSGAPREFPLERGRAAELVVGYDNEVPNELRYQAATETVHILNRNAGLLTRFDIATLCANLESTFAKHGIVARADVLKCSFVDGHWHVRLKLVRVGGPGSSCD